VIFSNWTADPASSTALSFYVKHELLSLAAYKRCFVGYSLGEKLSLLTF
jgi:hypothetical protein